MTRGFGIQKAVGCVTKASFVRWALFCFLLAFGSPASAQQGTTSLVGTVNDSATGRPVVDAVVTVTSPDLQGEELAVTDESGSYLIPGLPPGVYTMRVESHTFRPYERAGLDLHADTTIRLHVSLLPEQLQAEEVVVVGRTPTVDIGSSATGANITSEFTERVPLITPGMKGSAGRSFEAVADAVPGANTDVFGVSIFGSSSPENRYLLDGMAVNNPTFGLLGTPLSIDFIKEVSVLSGGYMPEYGRSTGGILNAITKSGTNEFHGSVFTYWSPGGIAGKPKTVFKEGQTIVTQPSLAYMGDIGGDVGGPLIRDKLWFYLGFDWSRTRYDLKRSLYRTLLDDEGAPIDDPANPGQSLRELIPGTTTTSAAEQDTFQGIAKLTWAPNARNRVNLSVNGVYPVSGGNRHYGIDPTTGQSEIQTGSTISSNGLNGPYSAIAHKYQASSTNALLKWSLDLQKDRAYLDTWLGYHHELFGRLPADGSGIGSTKGYSGMSNVWWTRDAPELGAPPRSITDFEKVPGGACDQPGSCPVIDYRTGGPEYVEQQKTHRVQGRSVLTYLFQAAGHHVLKLGLDFEHQTQNAVRGYTGGRDFSEAVDPDLGVYIHEQTFGYLTGPDTGPDAPVFLYQLHNRTRSLSMGAFIQDSWNVMDRVTINLGLRYDTQLLYGRDGSLAMALPNQWSPRVGVVFDPTQEGHAKIFANYARYFETVPLRMLDRYLSGEPVLLSAASSSSCDPLVPANLTSDSCLGNDALLDAGSPPNRKYVPFSQGTSVVDPNIKPPSTDEIVAGADYEILRDGRLGLTYTKRWLNNTIEDMSRDNGSTFFFGNPGRGLGNDVPKAERKYDGVTLFFTKLYSQRWLAQASYTLSWLRGNYTGLYRVEDLQFDPHQNSDFDIPAMTQNRYGPLPGDHRHYLKMFGAREFEIPHFGTLTPGAGFRAYSGEPTNYLGAYPNYGVDTIYLLPRGSGPRLPWTYTFDLRIAYGFKFGKTSGLVATMDVFNLFNFQRPVAVDQRYTSVEGEPLSDPAELVSLEKNQNFGKPTVYQPPRVFRFGLKGSF